MLLLLVILVFAFLYDRRFGCGLLLGLVLAGGMI